MTRATFAGWAGAAMRLIARFATERQGATVVEFALLLPVLLFTVMAVIQISWVLMATQHLENATADLGRLVRTGQVQGQKIDKQGMQALLCQKLSPMLSCSATNLFLEVRIIPDFGPTAIAWPIDKDGKFTGSGAYQVGAGGEVVMVRCFYQFSVWLPLIGPALSNMPNGNRMLVSTAAFRNEPFSR
jgi:Flp pilus assembly protein TadG